MLHLAYKLYKNRDVSHGYKHVLQVRENSLNICLNMNITDKYILSRIELASLFHDLWDHKYVNDSMYHKNKLKMYLQLLHYSDHEIQDVFIIIDNISFSKEYELIKNGSSIQLKHLQPLRDVVSDADKIEMLGISGIERIIEYEKYINKNCSIDEYIKIIKKIYYNKINILLDDNYIRTDYGKKIAVPLLDEMKNIIENEELLYNFVNDYI